MGVKLYNFRSLRNNYFGETEKKSKVAYLAAHMYICFTMSIVPPLVLWFEMWGARGDNIRMLRKFWDLW